MELFFRFFFKLTKYEFRAVLAGKEGRKDGRMEMFYLMMHMTHFIYGYMVSDIW